MTYRALLIGSSTFEADASLNPLHAPTKDVARLHRALVDSNTGLFDDDNVRLVTERTSNDILIELDTFFASAHRDDLLLFYYSGHGLLNERNELFLCGRNTTSDRLLSTAVSNVRINEFIAQSVARCTVILLDCCSSGMFKGGDIGQSLAGPGRYVISSTRGSALANDAATPTGTSLFTEHLVSGLLGDAHDVDGDGYVDLREIYDYVRAQLAATSKQIPHCRFDGDAAVSLARRRAPAISRVASGPSQRPGEPVFVLSENAIVLRDIGQDETLPPEVIEIYPLGDDAVDCTVETEARWLNAHVTGQRVVINLNPEQGPNRAKIMVRDRRSGTAQPLRVEAHVKRASASSSTAEGTPAKGSSPLGNVARPDVAPPPQQQNVSPPPDPPQQRTHHHQPPPQQPPWNPQHQAHWHGPATQMPPPRLGRPADPGLAALVTALVAFFLSFFFVGGVVAVVALVLAGQAHKQATRTGAPTGMSTAARVAAWTAIGIATLVLLVALAGGG
ncbi:MAG: caspase family protein [Actinomycetota bacterium]|nr:caspase family protein [Actinomycetota bacterium]